MPVVASISRMLERAAPILERLPQGGVVVEVGVSTALLAEHLLKTRPDIQWIGVDPWAARADQRECYVASGDIHATLADGVTLDNMRLARQRLEPFGERAAVLREFSPEAARMFGDESVDCIYLDGDHSLEGVRADLHAWWPIVKPNGFLGGHDWANGDPRFRFGVEHAVEEWLADKPHLEVELDTGLCWFVRKPLK